MSTNHYCWPLRDRPTADVGLASDAKDIDQSPGFEGDRTPDVAPLSNPPLTTNSAGALGVHQSRTAQIVPEHLRLGPLIKVSSGLVTLRSRDTVPVSSGTGRSSVQPARSARALAEVNRACMAGLAVAVRRQTAISLIAPAIRRRQMMQKNPVPNGGKRAISLPAGLSPRDRICRSDERQWARPGSRGRARSNVQPPIPHRFVEALDVPGCRW